MKLILNRYNDGHCEVILRDSVGINKWCHVFNNQEMAEIFCKGFNYGRQSAISLIQSLPMDFEFKG
jgi:hypothetical protein